MKNVLILTLLLSPLAFADEKPAGIPADYKLVYAPDFSKPQALDDWIFTVPGGWKISKQDDSAWAMEITDVFDKDHPKYDPKYRSPFEFGLLKAKWFTDVIIDCDVASTVKPYPHQDMCFIYGFKSPTQFYYTHIAVAPDPHAHNCFIVNNKERTAIGTNVSKGVTWGVDEWHHVRIVRRGSDGTTEAYFDDMTKPIMRANDKTFISGYVGLGSFDDKGKFKNVKIYAPSVEEKTEKIEFKSAK
jgi:hypothetical protein